MGGRDHDGRHHEGGQPMAPQVRTVAYVRVSTDKQLEHGLRKIGARLAARDLLPRQGKAWNPKTVRDLLQAEVA